MCVGPRSAVFAPLEELGLIVVDEEHDASYKHEGDPRYDARDVAAERAERSGAVLLLGSATPRPESVHRLPASVLAHRVDGRPLPAVQVLDMRGEAPGLHPLTAQALAEVRAVRRQGDRAAQQARLVELPLVSLVRTRVELSGLRRGARAAPCRWLPRMPSLRPPRGHPAHAAATAPRQPSRATARAPSACSTTSRTSSTTGAFRCFASTPTWSGEDRGVGEILRRFEAADRGILIGTQMVAKGHDFPDVSLGVVLDADATLRFPDFRAEERTFALIAQLAGRAGRGGHGRVLVQTIAP